MYANESAFREFWRILLYWQKGQDFLNMTIVHLYKKEMTDGWVMVDLYLTLITWYTVFHWNKSVAFAGMASCTWGVFHPSQVRVQYLSSSVKGVCVSGPIQELKQAKRTLSNWERADQILGTLSFGPTHWVIFENTRVLKPIHISNILSKIEKTISNSKYTLQFVLYTHMYNI